MANIGPSIAKGCYQVHDIDLLSTRYWKPRLSCKVASAYSKLRPRHRRIGSKGCTFAPATIIPRPDASLRCSPLALCARCSARALPINSGATTHSCDLARLCNYIIHDIRSERSNRAVLALLTCNNVPASVELPERKELPLTSTSIGVQALVPSVPIHRRGKDRVKGLCQIVPTQARRQATVLQHLVRKAMRPAQHLRRSRQLCLRTIKHIKPTSPRARHHSSSARSTAGSSSKATS